MRSIEDVERVVDQVLLTWDPPLMHDPKDFCLATCVQTGAMSAVAFMMAEDFPWNRLTDIQIIVLRQALTVYDEFLTLASTQENHMD